MVVLTRSLMVLYRGNTLSSDDRRLPVPINEDGPTVEERIRRPGELCFLDSTDPTTRVHKMDVPYVMVRHQ